MPSIAEIIEAEKSDRAAFEAKTDVPSKWGTFTIAEMRAAFEKIEDKTNWKNWFCMPVATADVNVTCAAIEFFHGAEPKVAAGDPDSVVYSPGYAAD